MTKVVENLLPLLLLNGWLLMNECQAAHTARSTVIPQEQNKKNSVGTSLQRCPGEVIYINATRCSKHAIAKGGAKGAKGVKLTRIHLKLGLYYQKEYFMCDNAQSYVISFTLLAKLTEDWGCIPFNLSRHWLLENSTALVIGYAAKNGSEQCILKACTTFLHTGSSNAQQHQQSITQTLCETYESNEVLFALCGFFIVLSLFALFHDAALMRIGIFITIIVMSLALSEQSWMYFSFLFVFILLFIFTGASTSARFIKSFIFFMQTYFAIFPGLTLYFSQLFTLLRFNGLHFKTMPCLFRNSLIYSVNSKWNNLISSFCAPLVALFIILCFTLLRRVLRLCTRRSRNDTPLYDQIAFALVFVAYYSFFNSSTLAFKTFRNSSVNSEEYHLAIIGLIGFGLLPIAVFTALLYKYRSNLSNERVLSRLGYLYKSYRPENDSGQTRWQYYEIVFMCFRFILASILTLITKRWKFFLVIGVLLLMILFYYKMTPFTDIWANFVILVPIVSLIIINVFILLPDHLTIKYDLIYITFLVTTSFYVKIIVPGGCRQCCMNIKASCRCHERSEGSPEDSRRLLGDGATGEGEHDVRVRVIANLIEEHRGVEVIAPDTQRQYSNHVPTDRSEGDNNGCGNLSPN